MVSVAKLARFKRLGVFFGELLDVDVLQIRLGRGREADTRCLEELNDFAGVTVDGAVSLVVDDEIEIERRELLTVATIHHQRLNRGDHDRRTEQFARATRCLVDDRFELAEDDVEIFQRLFRQFDAVNDKQDALCVSRQQEPTDKRSTEKRLARASSHFEQELPARFVVEPFGDGIHRADLIAANGQVRLE